MSRGYGYYTISFYKKDASPDFEKAKEAFDWCKETYDWFTKDEPFDYYDSIITYNAQEYPDGIDIDNTSIPVSKEELLDWLRNINDAVHPELMLCRFWLDFGTCSFENSFYYILFEDGELKLLEELEEFNRGFGRVPCYSDDWDLFVCYVVSPTEFSLYRGKFRNTKTGEITFAGYLRIEEEEGDTLKFSQWCNGDIDDHDDAPALCNANNDRCATGQSDVDSVISTFDHFDDKDFDPVEFYFAGDEEKEFIEFLGFGPERHEIDIYLEKLRKKAHGENS